MQHGAYISGIWQAGEGEMFARRSPASGEVVWEGRAASRAQVERAVAVAREAQAEWALRPNSERVEALRRWGAWMAEHKERIAESISREVGKPMWEARGEAGACAGKVGVSIAAQEERAGEKSSGQGQLGEGMRLSHHAHGVVAVFGPFNFPLHLPNGHAVPALLAGNAVVIKPSELAPGTGALFAEAAEAAGLPEGLVNIVQGARGTGGALLEAGVDGVLFTGSARTGVAFHKHFAGRPEVMLALELGGNNPLVIHDAPTPEVAADIAAVSAYISAGQRCSCARRLIVPDDAFGAAVVERIAARIPSIPVGAPEDDVFMGPVVSPVMADAALAFEADLVARGAKAIVGFTRPDPEGAYLTPALVDSTGVDVPDEELFAPLLQVVRVSGGLDAMVAEANRTRFGLAAGVVTEDDVVWERARARLRAGIVNRNLPTTGASGSMPFGGPGLSGNGRPGAWYAADYSAWPKASRVSGEIAAPNFPGWPD